MRPVASDTHIALLRQKRPPAEIDRSLFSAYLGAENWSAAAVILRGMPEDDAREERARFVEAIAAKATQLIESRWEARYGMVRVWLELAEEFDPQNPTITEVRSLLAARETGG